MTRAEGRGDVVLLAFAAVSMAVLLLQLLDFGYGRDQGIYAAVAEAIRHGGVPYRDAWDFKPPGIFYIYTAATMLPGSAERAIRWIEVASLLSIVPACAILARTYLGDARAGVLSAALAVLIHVQSEFWDTAQPESFGAVCAIWGLVTGSAAVSVMQPADARRRRWLWAATGALYGAAFFLKPTVGAAGVVPLAIGLVRQSRASGPRMQAMASIAACFLAGAAGAALLSILPFLVRGGLDDFRIALFEFAPRYTAVSWRALFPHSAWWVLSDWLYGYSLVNLVGLLLLALPPLDERTRAGIVHIGGAIAVMLAGVAVQQKFFLYHYGAALPLTAILAGWGYWKLSRRIGTRWYGAAAVCALLVVLAGAVGRLVPTRDTFFARCALRLREWTHPAERQAIRDRLYSLYDYVGADNRQLAEWIRRDADSSGPLFVWGFTPELYPVTGRQPASRYIYNVPQRAPWSRDASRAELMSALRMASPAVIVVEHGDAVPQVTGTMADSAWELQTFPELRGFVAAGYDLAFHVPKFHAYRRKR